MREQLVSLLQQILGLGPTVVVPIFITLLGLVFRQKLKDAFESGILVGIGLLGVFAVIGIMAESVIPAVSALVNRLGVKLTAVDTGCAAILPMLMALPVVIATFGLNLVFNIFLIAIKQTKTLNIDVWNYVIEGFVAALFYGLTRSIWISLGAAMVFYFLLFKNGDWAAPAVQSRNGYGFPGVTWIWASIPLAPIGFFLNKVMDHIPGLNKLEADPETIRNKLGLFGQAPIIGLFMGALIGVLAGVGVAGTLKLAIALAGVMVLLPKMLGVLMEGLVPFADRVQRLVEDRFRGREIYIGLDGAIGAGYVPLLATTMLIIPLAPLIAIILPGNTTLPMVDLALAWIWGMWGAAAARGNIVRGFITHVLMTVLVLYFAGWMAPFVTEAVKLAGGNVPEGVLWTSPVMASTLWPVFLLIFYLFFTGAPDIFGFNPLVMLMFAVVFLAAYGAMWRWVRDEPRRLAAGAVGAGKGAGS